jgi:hypothetical protein
LKCRVVKADLQASRTIRTFNGVGHVAVNSNLSDTDNEQISLAAAAELPELRIDGHPADRTSLWRWATRGCRGVVLETTQVGEKLTTTRWALRRFLDTLNGRRAGVSLAAAKGQAQKRHRQAEKALEAARI